ncbi:MAG: hypothetical protein VKJ06_08535 [Vampirovibrionales bacterium]|nr:hypothetical protein [Vampirovibrionales bacterium]
MSQLNRLHEGDIANGNLIDAAQLNAEFNQLLAESNAQDARASALEGGNMTIGGAKTFSGTVKVEALEERTPGNGVTIETVRLLDGRVKLSAQATPPASPQTGELWYAQSAVSGGANGPDQFRARLAAQTVTLHHALLAPPRFTQAPSYISASQIKLPAGTAAHTEEGRIIALLNDVTLTLAINGPTGLDAGTESANTWYYAWLISDTTGANAPSAVFSASRLAPVLPAGFDQAALLAAIAFRNDAAGDLIPFFLTGWPYGAFLQYQVYMQRVNAATSSPTQALNTSNAATTWTDLDLSAFVPPFVSNVLLKVGGSEATGAFKFRTKGQTHEGIEFFTSDTLARYKEVIFPMATDASQRIQYSSSVSGMALDVIVMGWSG